MKTDMAWMEDAACAHHYRFTELDEAQQLPLCQGCTVGDSYAQIHTQLTAIIAAALHPQTKETK